MTLSQELAWRGFVNQTTFHDITELDKETRTFYFGCDPSSDSLQIGNLAGGMMARVFIKHGYTPVLLVGGATGMIGDPKDNEERQLKDMQEVAHNKQAIAKQYKTIFDDMDFTLVDNYDWFKDMGYLEFLRTIGKQFPMTQLLDRDFVKSRIGEGGVGISYAEFSYSLIQGYDFLHLYREYGVTLQIGGSDQWGNMLSGVPLIRKLEGAEAHVWTLPLIVNKTTGRKFGKSEEGTIWLDADKTSPYKFYQFWLNADDEGVGEYMKVFTLIEPDEFDALMATFKADPGGRAAQKYLAYEATKLIHGKDRADSVRKVSEVLFGGGDYTQLQPEDFEILQTELPVVESRESGLATLLVQAGLAGSNTEARRFVGSRAVYVNGVQIAEGQTDISSQDLLHGRIVLRRGKNSQAVIKVSHS